MSEYTVIDVSQFQGTIDWPTVKPQIHAAIIRIGIGNDQTDQDDTQAARNISECERLGIPWGAYVYSYASTKGMVQSEFAHMKRMLKGRKPMLPWYLDLEEKDCASFARQAAQEWYDLCKADGVAPGVYASTCYYTDHIKTVPGDTSLWIADYRGAKPNIGRAYDGWQYTSKGRVNGIRGNVDLSIWYKSLGGKWTQEWHYYNSDGSEKKNAWQKDSQGWCYLDGNGKAVRNRWIKWNGDWYYLKNDYHMAANEYAYDSHGKCWLGKDGKWDGKYY